MANSVRSSGGPCPPGAAPPTAAPVSATIPPVTRRRILAAVLLLAAVAFGVVGVRSYWLWDAAGVRVNRTALAVQFMHGTAFAGYGAADPTTIPHAWWWVLQPTPATVEDVRLGFYARREPNSSVVGVPCWLLVVLLLLPVWRLARPRPHPPGACPHCGYDLRATPARCPECGAPTTPAPAPAASGTSASGV